MADAPFPPVTPALELPFGSPVHAKMLIAETLEPSEHRVDLSLLLDEGGQRILAQPGVRLLRRGDHLGLKIDLTTLFLVLTSMTIYGWRKS
jgi:hypothetical protein